MVFGSHRTTKCCLGSPAMTKHSVTQAWRIREQMGNDCSMHDRRRDVTVVFSSTQQFPTEH